MHGVANTSYSTRNEINYSILHIVVKTTLRFNVSCYGSYLNQINPSFPVMQQKKRNEIEIP